MSNSEQKKILNGPFIYNEDKDRVIYYDVFTKNAYIIPENESKSYLLYVTSIFVSLFVFVLIGVVFNLKFIYCFLLEVAFLIMMRLLFKFNFLNRLGIDTRFKPYKKKLIIFSVFQGYNISRLLLMLGLLLLLGVSMHLKCLDYERGTNYFVSYCAMAIMSYGLSAVMAISIIVNLYNRKIEK